MYTRLIVYAKLYLTHFKGHVVKINLYFLELFTSSTEDRKNNMLE